MTVFVADLVGSGTELPFKPEHIIQLGMWPQKCEDGGQGEIKGTVPNTFHAVRDSQMNHPVGEGVG